MGRSNIGTTSLPLEVLERGAELRLWLRLDLRLLVERSDGSLVDLVEERRSGMMTTGMAPLLMTSRRALWLDNELKVLVETRVCRARSSAPGRSCRTSWRGRDVVVVELLGDISEPESRRSNCFRTCRRVLLL